LICPFQFDPRQGAVNLDPYCVHFLHHCLISRRVGYE
jgi:hypothetical protein